MIEIALQIGKHNVDAMQVIRSMKFGDKKDLTGFTPQLFERKNRLSKVSFIQKVKSDKLNWLFNISTV